MHSMFLQSNQLQPMILLILRFVDKSNISGMRCCVVLQFVYMKQFTNVCCISWFTF